MTAAARSLPLIVPTSVLRKAEPTPKLKFVPGQMVIRIKAKSVSHLRAAMSTRLVSRAALAAVPELVGHPLEYIQNNMGLKSMKPLFVGATPKAGAGVRVAAMRAKVSALTSVVHAEDSELSGINLVEVDEKEVTAARMKHLQQSDAVEFVERVPAHWLVARKKRVPKGADSRLNLQWGLRAIGWFEATRPSAESVEVAVLDTGVDQTHPDLVDVIAAYETNGFTKRDIVGHGTHVCGIIGAMANNSIGIAGVANCRIHVWKIFSDTPYRGEFYVDTDAYLTSLRAAANSGARVINLSIGGTESSQTEQILFNYVTNRGALVVAAMGNEYQEGNPTEYPAAYDRVLPVGAIGVNLARAEFSNTGQPISVSAPGVGILSTLPMMAAPPYRTEKEYDSWDGTSMATPHVVGAAALLLAKRPTLGPSQVRRRLEQSAQKVPHMNGKRFTREYGRGLVNLPKLLK
jgi:tRNA threonylcarbamoyladenosine modification (KEOPS) complex  Pcc1 subunit